MEYLLNIHTGIIHNGETPCHRARKIKQSNQMYFDTYEEAVNFFNGNRKGEPCGICMKDYDE